MYLTEVHLSCWDAGPSTAPCGLLKVTLVQAHLQEPSMFLLTAISLTASPPRSSLPAPPLISLGIPTLRRSTLVSTSEIVCFCLLTPLSTSFWKQLLSTGLSSFSCLLVVLIDFLTELLCYHLPLILFLISF